MAIGPVFEAESEIAALFQLPPEAFVNARNALAASLKKDGHAEASARVKALPKPPVPVWAVNQLHWQRTPVLDRLIAAGDRFRQTQTARLTGGGADLRESFDERRDALAAAVSAVSEILRRSGHTPSPDVLRRVTTTLEALATLGTTVFAPPRGRLIADLAPQGFEALSALIPRNAEIPAPEGRGAVVPFGPPGARGAGGATPTAAQARRDEQAARAAAARAVRTLERELALAQTALRRARAAMKAAAAKAKAATRARAAVERAKATVDRRYAAASGKAEAALAAAHERARAAEAAAEAVQQAERGVKLARERAGGNAGN